MKFLLPRSKEDSSYLGEIYFYRKLKLLLGICWVLVLLMNWSRC